MALKIHTPVTLPPPSGYGPWKVMLSANVHPNPGKKTEIRVHTYCELVVRAMNEGPRDWWVPMLECGPFDSWSAAVVFKGMWESTTRNLRNRIDKGWELFQRYQKDYNLVAWYQHIPMRQYMHMQGWETNDDCSRSTTTRRRRRAVGYREMNYDQTSPRISVLSIRNVESKRRCLGSLP